MGSVKRSRRRRPAWTDRGRTRPATACSYRDGQGGRVGIYGRGNRGVDDDDPICGMGGGDPLPPSGFYAVECTGRRLVVDGRALRKGQSAMLRHGSAVRVGSYCLYFLLPTLSEAERREQRTMKVAVEVAAVKSEQPPRTGDGVEVKRELLEASRAERPSSKPTKPTTARPRLSPSAPTSSGPAAPASPKRARTGEDLSSLIRRLESKSDEEIMGECPRSCASFLHTALTLSSQPTHIIETIQTCSPRPPTPRGGTTRVRSSAPPPPYGYAPRPPGRPRYRTWRGRTAA